MTKIIKKNLPNAISFAEIPDATMKKKVMLLQENIRCLASQLAELQDAVMELQKK